MTRRFLGFFILGGGLCASAAAIVACGEDDTTITSPTNNNDGGGGGGGGDSSTSTSDGGGDTTDGSDSNDGGREEDADRVSDGGENIDPDGGEIDDAGDAGPCNAVVNAAGVIASSCVSDAPVWGGGALVAGTYHLKQVKLLAKQPFCANQFQPVAFKETLDLTVDMNGVGTMNLVAKVGANGTERTRTTTIDPPANNASPLASMPVCPPRNGGSIVYFSGLRNQKQMLILRGQYGNSSLADYHFEKQ